MKLPLIFALATAFFWGLYGPALAQSRAGLGSPFKPYVMIGAAYLVWGIIGGVVGMMAKGDTFSFAGAGSFWGFSAGSLGAWGALTLTLAMFSGGSRIPHVVMPIVFGGAVTISAVVGIVRTWAHEAPSPWLGIGMATILLGAIITAAHTPHERPPTRPPSAQQTHAMR